jgi:hypothetical protein
MCSTRSFVTMSWYLPLPEFTKRLLPPSTVTTIAFGATPDFTSSSYCGARPRRSQNAEFSNMPCSA